MGPFQLLFDITVRHRFFEPGPCRGLVLRPTVDAARRLRAAGCLVRESQAGIAVFHDASVAETLRARASQSDDPFELFFLGHAVDAGFANYTDGLAADRNSVLYLDTALALAPDADGVEWLHEGTTASKADRLPLFAPQIQASPLWRALSSAERLLPPALVLHIVVGGAETCAAWAAHQTGRHYALRLGSRETRWKYHLPADWAEQDPQVVDLAGHEAFGAAAQQTLEAGRTALTVYSETAIALHDQPPQRFQLQARSPAADRVLVKRLPVASAGQLNLEMIDGVRTLVSEIYVIR